MTKDQVDKIMLVDDNVTDRFIHKKLLDIYGIGKSVIECDSGRSALNYLRSNKDFADKLPDVILLDVLMPEMSGFDFLVHLDNNISILKKKPLVFMLSSTDDEQDLRKARKSKIVQRLLRKPFSPDTFIKALAESKL